MDLVSLLVQLKTYAALPCADFQRQETRKVVWVLSFLDHVKM